MPEPSLGIVVVIPCFNEPELGKSLQSLANCNLPECSVEIIVVVNFGEHVDSSIKANCYSNYEETKALSSTLSTAKFTIRPILIEDIACKQAGVGFARKTGMDEAAYRFMQLNRPNGTILCFDADSGCDDNYFTAVEQYYKENPKTQAFSVYYEHPVNGNDYTEEIYQGIAQYELHLRYYNQACRIAGLPFAYHTVGSSMGCTASAYAKVGGMNKRKAGEDFYFLQKLIPLGNFAEINTTRVIPSPRISDRVPFGTGRAMMKYINEQQNEILTYRFGAFKAVKDLIDLVPKLYQTSRTEQFNLIDTLYPELRTYLQSIGFYEAMEELHENSGDYFAFKNRFFKWFDAFRTLKFMNRIHEDHWDRKPVSTEAAKLLSVLKNEPVNSSLTVKELLEEYRTIERA